MDRPRPGQLYAASAPKPCRRLRHAIERRRDVLRQIARLRRLGFPADEARDLSALHTRNLM